MVTRQNDEKKLFEIWLTNEERRSEALMASLKPLYGEWRARGYMPVVFCSGGGDLYGETLELLKNSRRRTAEREIKAEKEARDTQSVRAQLRELAETQTPSKPRTPTRNDAR